jgi:hypothetical protein
MMNKIASDAYSQGAYEALSQMDVPGHIKQAAVQYLTKEAISVAGAKQLLSAGGGRVADAFRSAGGLRKGVVEARLARPITRGPGAIDLSAVPSLNAARLKDLGIAGGLTAAGVGAGAYGLGAFDDDDFVSRAQEGDLSNAEIAALTGGTAALGAGGAYAAGLL